MEMQVSAFEIYQKRNKKRKVPSHNEELKTASMKKKRVKQIQLNDRKKPKSRSSIAQLKKKPIKNNTNKGNESITNFENGSDDVIPTLIPIVDYKSSKTMKPKAKAAVNLTKEYPIIITNGNAKKTFQISKQTTKLASSKSNPMNQSLAIFKWLLDPITPKEFFEKYWEQDVLLIKRANRNYFSDVFSSEKLDNILREFPLHFTRNVDVVAYQNGKKEVMDEEGRALPSKLWDFYNNGCSVRILNPQTYDKNVHSVISSLQEYFGTMVGTNIYLTPPDSQGFAPHFDDIEAFIVQLEGCKYWKLYRPKEEDVLARDSSPNFTPEDLGDPFLEVKLEAGDLLYFPRGTIHEGHTKESEHSLHITISVYQHTAYIDLLEQALPNALKQASKDDLEFRKGLPLNYLKHLGVVNKNDKSDKRDFLIDKVKSLVNKLVDYLDVDSAADNLGRKFMHDAMPPLFSKEEAQHSCKSDGEFMKNGKVYNRVEINADIKIRLLRYYALRVVRESDTTSKLYFCTENAETYHGEEEQWLEIENSFIPAVQMLQQKYPEFLVVDSLPIKDEIEKLTLVSSLWEHGLLVTDGPLPNIDSDGDSDANSSIDSNQLEEILTE